MANVRWIGQAQAVAQVDTVTVALTWAQNDTVTLTINGKDLVVTIGTSATTDDVATAIKEAWEGETLTDTTASYTPSGGGDSIAEFAEVTATVSGSVVTLTHDTAGVPFTLSVTESTAGSGTATEATATTATGANYWSNADNWDTGSVPVTTDDVYIDDGNVSILYDLDASAVTLTSLTIGSSYTGEIGLPKDNANGYPEYRDDYLQISATTVTIGADNIGNVDGSGSPRLKLDLGSVQATVNVKSTGSSAEQGLEAFVWKGTNVSNELEVISGSVAVAPFLDETANLAAVRNDAGSIRFGNGVTFESGSTVTNETGELRVATTMQSLTNTNGTVIVTEDAALVTCVHKGGQLAYRASGNITTLTIGGGALDTTAVLDASSSFDAVTIATLNLKPRAQILDPLRKLTYTSIVFDSDVDSIQIG